MLLAGAVAGGLWGALPGLLKAYRGVHEVISTIMLNYLGLNIVTYLVTHNLKDPKSSGHADRAHRPFGLAVALGRGQQPDGGLCDCACPRGRGHVSGAAERVWAIRYGPSVMGAEAARAAGIPVARVVVTTMSLSGALAGVAGAIEVMGVHHRYVEGVAGNYGFDGIAVALLGGLGGVAVTLSAFFFGFLAGGADYMETLTNVPNSIAVIVQAFVILFVGIRVLRRPRTDVAALLRRLPHCSAGRSVHPKCPCLTLPTRIARSSPPRCSAPRRSFWRRWAASCRSGRAWSTSLSKV